MTDRDQPVPHSEPLPLLGRSIFPPFKVNVPMPDGTAVPPHPISEVHPVSTPSASRPANSGP